MIKKENLIPSQGFELGALCLYVGPGGALRAFYFKGLADEVYETRDPDRVSIRVNAWPHGPDSIQTDLEKSGDLYPVMSKQFALFGPALGFGGVYAVAQVKAPEKLGHEEDDFVVGFTATINLAHSDRAFEHPREGEVIDCPLWALKY